MAHTYGPLDAEPLILQVRVYGSRQSGVRRPKDPLVRVDIDLAIQVRPSYPGETPFTVLFSIKRRLKDSGCDLRLHIGGTDRIQLRLPRGPAGRRVGL
jgi:hypothetical protein